MSDSSIYTAAEQCMGLFMSMRVLWFQIGLLMAAGYLLLVGYRGPGDKGTAIASILMMLLLAIAGKPMDSVGEMGIKCSIVGQQYKNSYLHICYLYILYYF
jgi:hypothetical protein